MACRAQDDAVAAVHVSSGYFNMTKAYERCMLASQAAFSILTAAPEVRQRRPAATGCHTRHDAESAARSLWNPRGQRPNGQANGFFGSKGISYYIPAAYTCIETNFLRHVERTRATDRVHVHEYTRPAWTFHAKGSARRTGRRPAQHRRTASDLMNADAPAAPTMCYAVAQACGSGSTGTLPRP